MTDQDTATADVVDRSTLETYAACPCQGQAVEQRRVMTASAPTEIGTEAHRVIAVAIAAFATGDVSAEGIRELLHTGAQKSRPDVQPEVVSTLRGSAHMISQLLAFREDGEPRHPNDVMRFDGGEGDRSGQLAWEPRLDLPVCTGAVDLLLATESEAELDLYDWKTGRTWFNSTAVSQSFQFAFYSAMIFENYPDCDTVNVRVLMTRFSAMAPVVRFARTKLDDYTARILSALTIYDEHRDSPRPPTWPHTAKCQLCPASGICPEATRDVRDFADDPAAGLQQLAVLGAATKTLKAAARAYWKANGEFRAAGLEFGMNKPAKKRAPVPDMYAIAIDTDQGADSCDTP